MWGGQLFDLIPVHTPLPLSRLTDAYNRLRHEMEAVIAAGTIKREAEDRMHTARINRRILVQHNAQCDLELSICDIRLQHSRLALCAAINQLIPIALRVSKRKHSGVVDRVNVIAATDLVIEACSVHMGKREQRVHRGSSVDAELSIAVSTLRAIPTPPPSCEDEWNFLSQCVTGAVDSLRPIYGVVSNAEKPAVLAVARRLRAHGWTVDENLSSEAPPRFSAAPPTSFFVHYGHR